MLLRIRSKEGMHRVQVDNGETFWTLAQKISELLKIEDPSTIAMGRDPNPATAASLSQLADKTIESANLKHGDIVYVSYIENNKSTEELNNNDSTVVVPRDTIKQDAVDDFLEKQRGLIDRKKDPKFCRHGDKAMCDYCMPLEPFDPRYLEENKIKHMSFHAYLRQLNAAQQTKNIPVLEEPDYKAYRMVDHVEFSSASIIDSFLNYWRASGSQRFGYLYGRYEPYLEVPLGVKAVVEAIYEPPQQDHSDGIQLTLPWEEENRVNEVAEACGLVRVGMIYSDLLDDGSGSGKVIAKRHVNSYFLSSVECAFAAEMQRRHPNASKQSISGKFSSKFVTCVISGDTEGNIDVNAYQVSDTLVALQEANFTEPSRNPSLMRVKDSIPHERYVPEVFYKFKNEYNVVVKQSAKPTFPVEYLLINVTHGFPHNPSPLFNSTSSFPVENREGLSHQSMSELAKVINSADNEEALKNALADFHLLCFIQSTDIMSPEEFRELCQIVTQFNSDIKRLNELNGWKTLELLLKETGTKSASGTKNNLPAEISCRHCTFMNPSSNESCEMCGLPLSG
ncbi:hypothetical protein G6F46_005649 [Rhizopus delemar]|uniref:Nuclear protein localization protein 4 n=3 Tax=Rhizopus TaxID=4842 RepID=I1C0E3_RHIO9|nr:hypothetical protein RO3G_06628 [Rhizopus delemar RA 99-880]KAG1054231.1 hypothetical protein G6F43_003741 [Rhizopus delemar]KAG1547461.1 hypothetical protein G6F51_004252 [Rhizopus arrhizus]KAG1460356.1 hypothetical protein G6F55_004215 [Rhizopus delemar]KAG1500458.1 hypothetical protein G6F54_003706 [Rhizopus delemar]|eukprot:EIE81923.1 hypothetical protein RO3G_06628 [Rhizopus delemar RA 99-880]